MSVIHCIIAFVDDLSLSVLCILLVRRYETNLSQVAKVLKCQGTMTLCRWKRFVGFQDLWWLPLIFIVACVDLITVSTCLKLGICGIIRREEEIKGKSGSDGGRPKQRLIDLQRISIILAI